MRHILVLLTLLVVSANAMASQEPLKYTEKNPLIYEDSRDLWPFVFIDKKGHPDGLNVAVVKSLLGRLKIPYRIRLRTTEKAREDLLRDSADLYIGLYTDYNSVYGQFGKKTISSFSYGMLSQKKDAMKHVTVDDLRKKYFFVHKNSLAQNYLGRLGLEENMIPIDDVDKMLLNVSMNDSGLVVWNNVSLKYLKMRYHLDDLVLSPVDMPPGEYRFMSNDEALLHKLDSVFELMRSSGELHALTTRWLNSENKPKEEGFSTQEINILAVIAFLLLLALYYIYWRYRHVVKRDLADIITQMDLVLNANRTDVWVYYPMERRFSWVNERGEVTVEHSSFEFSQNYVEDGFSLINEKLSLLLTGQKQPETLTVRGYSATSRDQIIDIEVVMEAMRDDFGRVYLVTGVQHDITDSKSKVIRKRELTNRYHTLFNTEYRSTYKFDAEGFLEDLNNRAVGFTNDGTREAVLERRYNIFSMKTFTLEQLTSSDQLLFCAKVPNGEWKKNFPLINEAFLPSSSLGEGSDQHTYVEVELTPICNERGEIQGHILTLLNLTDTVRIIHENAAMKERYDEVVSSNETQLQRINYSLSVSDMMLARYIPAERACRFTNAVGKEIQCFTQLQLIEQTDFSDLKKVFEIFHIADACEDKELHYDVKTTALNEKQEQRVFAFHMRPVYDADHKVIQYFGICSDITAQLSANLQLQREKERAFETEKLKQNFLRNMSYRIRTPLLSISRHISRLAKMRDMSRKDEVLDGIVDDTSRLISLSDDTLYLSRLNAGLLTPNPQPTDFAHLFTTAFDAAVHKYYNEDVKYNLENAYDSLMLDIDSDIIMRILRESISLSARYTISGTLTARYVHRRDTLSVYIEDSGQGIPPAVFEKIYEPRVTDEYDSKNGHSSGLEMAIVKSLVTLIGGNIDIYSAPGRGIFIEITIKI